jgi:predicted DNA-binding transcriptional regulator YafY
MLPSRQSEKAAMRRSDRLFDIIQALRTAKGPMTAAALADQFEVTVRTIYRDVAALQARRVPIEGAPGFGYVLRRGFDLPPLMFTTEEIEAIAVAMRMLRRTGDRGLHAAARNVLSKVTVALPDALREQLATPQVFVSSHGAPAPPVADLSAIRAAIRDERKLRLAYGDGKGDHTQRVVWPFAIAYYAESTLVSAWCELRNDFRHFRADRILDCGVLEESFPVGGKELFARWQARFVPGDETRPV